MDLIIVESPTKARTLSRFLGKDYSVEATLGHIKDLPKSTLGIDLDNNFKPDYVDVEKKAQVVKAISQKAKIAVNVYLATDPDREGEAISSHIKDVLLKSKISPSQRLTRVGDKNQKSKIARIVFHEITKEAVEGAIKNPQTVNNNLVNAQIARRVLDRLVGYKLSPLLWKKVRRGLSAGRVQSVTVRLIVEREREIEAFKAVEYWEIFADVARTKQKKDEFRAKLIKLNAERIDIGNGNTAKEIEKALKIASYRIGDVRKRDVHKGSYSPFTTSTLTISAARIFSWSAKKTMNIAQKLYEEGLITYHRTDSTSLSKTAVEKVRKYIKNEYGDKYLPDKPRVFKTKAKVAQEAHEAIRPTNVSSKFKLSNTKFAKDAEILYLLIWKRFVAGQMTDSVYSETVIDVVAVNGKDEYLLRASGQIMIFDGWKKIYNSKNDTVYLPEVNKGDQLHLNKVISDQKFTQPPARYNEASLIKTLEKLGIGRPSTYAPTISTIQIRNYVEKDEGRFTPTPVGIAVNDFLITNFPNVFEYSFTAKMEDDLDNIAKGEVKWTGVLGDFWSPFKGKLEVVEKKSNRVKIEAEKLGRKCTKCKKGELVLRIGRFGKFISCARFPDCDYTEKYIEKLNMKCLECAKGDVIVKTTRKGRKFYGCDRYPECKWASWKNPKLKNEKET